MYRVGDTPRITALSMERGAQWWILSRDFAEWFIESRVVSVLAELMAHTPMPDERLFQTALMVSPFASYGISLNYHWQLARTSGPSCDIERAATFVGVFWCGTGPRWIQHEDIDILAGPPQAPLFVRKMHPLISSKALEYVDQARTSVSPIWIPIDNTTMTSMLHIWQWLAILALKRSLAHSPPFGSDEKANNQYYYNDLAIVVDSVHVLDRLHIVSFPSQSYDRIYRVQATLSDPLTSKVTSLQWQTRVHLGGWVTGALLRNDIGTLHSAASLAVTGRLWIILSNQAFTVQQWWLPSILPWNMKLEILPARAPTHESASLTSSKTSGCQAIDNAVAVATMSLVVQANWRYTWTQVKGIVSPGMQPRYHPLPASMLIIMSLQ
jgi:hypothetical protein